MTGTAPPDGLATSPIPHPLDAVIFDMDGTLLDTEAAHHRAMREAAGMMGHDLTDAVLLRLIGVHREENERTLAAHFGAGFSIADFYDEADRRFEAMLDPAVPMRPGALPLLEALAGLGIPLGLATSTASPLAQERLAAAGIDHLFATVVTRSDVARPKPDPEPFLLAARRLGARPAHCVAIEDSPNGLRAAAASGMAAILVPDLVPANDETRGLAAAVLDNLDAVGALIAEARRSTAADRSGDIRSSGNVA